MAAVREWLTTVAAVTLLLSVAQTLVPPGGPLRETVSQIGGLILLLVLLQPLWNADLPDIRLDFSACQAAVAERQAELEQQQNADLTAHIEAETEAYISDKAQTMGLILTVCVAAEQNENGVPVPVRVEINGAYSGELAAWMEAELGLQSERQVWNEN